jgi:hypothetical protein
MPSSTTEPRTRGSTAVEARTSSKLATTATRWVVAFKTQQALASRSLPHPRASANRINFGRRDRPTANRRPVHLWISFLRRTDTPGVIHRLARPVGAPPRHGGLMKLGTDPLWKKRRNDQR